MHIRSPYFGRVFNIKLAPHPKDAPTLKHVMETSYDIIAQHVSAAELGKGNQKAAQTVMLLQSGTTLLGFSGQDCLGFEQPMQAMANLEQAIFRELPSATRDRFQKVTTRAEAAALLGEERMARLDHGYAQCAMDFALSKQKPIEPLDVFLISPNAQAN